MKVVHPLRELKKSFRARIFVLLAILILSVSTAFTFVHLREERKSQRERLVMKGELLAQILADSNRLALFAAHKEFLQQSADGILQNDDVLSVTIFSTTDAGFLIHRSRTADDGKPGPEGKAELARHVMPLLQRTGKPLHLLKPNRIDCYAPVFTSAGVSSPEYLYFADAPGSIKKHMTGITRVVVDTTRLDAHLRELLLSGITLAGTFLGCSVMVAYLVARRVTHPVQRLMAGVEALQHGNLAARIPVESEDELGEVSRAFNVMARRLEEREGEKRELEEKLRHAQKMEAKEEWERTFDTVPDLIAILDRDHRIVRVNEAMADNLGITKEAAVGTRIYEHLHTERPNTVLVSALSESSTGNGIEFFQQKLAQHFVVTLSPMRKMDGAFHGSVYVARDVTKRKVAADLLRKSEERFRLIAETIVEAFWIADMESEKFAYMSPGYERIWGRSPHHLYENPIEFLESVHPDDRPRVQAARQNRKRQAPFEVEYRIIRADGEIRWISDRGYPVAGGGEWGHCYTGVAFDISEQKQAAEERRNIQAKLVQMNKMTSLGLMVSGLGHEVNNPNNMIKMAIHLLARSWQDFLPVLEHQYRQEGDFHVAGLPFSEAKENIPRQLDAIKTNSLRIEGIIRNLRQYALKGEARLEELTDVNRVVSSAAGILHSQIKLYTHRFQLELQECIPAIKGNAQQLEQVVINLIINALQALPDKDRGVLVMTRFEPAGPFVVITVRDEGEGMPAEIRNRLGEPFFSTKLDRGGTGLGLAISKFIVSEHKGVFEVESEPGDGATISVKLPVSVGASCEGGYGANTA